MFVARKFETIASLDDTVPYACGACGVTTPARCIVVAVGGGVSPFMLDNEGARERSETSAAGAAREKLQRVVAIATCPRCGQRDGTARRRFFERATLRACAFALPCALGVAVFLLLGSIFITVFMAMGVIVLAGIVVRETRAELHSARYEVEFVVTQEGAAPPVARGATAGS